MQQIIYCIYDLIADHIVGQLLTRRHDAAAIRDFADVASDPNTWIAKHPADFELRELGLLTAECAIIPNPSGYRSVITGSAWLAAQSKGPQLADTNDA